MPKIIVALFIIVIILVIAFLWRHKASSNPDIPTGTETPLQVEDKGKPTDQTPSNDANNEEDETNGEASDDDANDNDEQDEVNQTLTHIQVAGQDSMYELEGTDSFKLEIRTTGPSWIGVTDQTGKELTAEARTMDAGEKLELDVSDVEKVRIRVGRTGEAEIYVNGEKLTYATDAITQNIHIEYKK